MDLLSTSGPIAESGANVLNQITGIGFGVTMLFIALGFSVFANVMQFKRNSSLVDQMFTILPQATAQVLQAVAEFKEVVRDLVQKT